MNTDQERKLDDLAREIGVRVLPDLHGELHPEDLGGWFPRSRRILYRLGLDYTNTICTVAHELGHATLDHSACPPSWLHARQEAKADEFAAELLITPEAYEAAERLAGCHDGALAAELGVTTELIRVWRGIHEGIRTP